MNKYFLLIIFLTVTLVLFGEELEYITIRKTMLYDNNTTDLNKLRDALFEIDKDIKVKYSVLSHVFKKTKENIIVGTFIYNNKNIYDVRKYYFDCADLIPANTVDTFDPSFISDLNNGNRKTWIPAYYIKVLQSLDRDTILTLDKHWREFDRFWLGSPYPEEWYERFLLIFPCNEFDISNSALVLNSKIGMMIKNIKKTNNGYIVTVKFAMKDWEIFKHDDLNWDNVKGKEFFDMILCIDGDYMDVYLDDMEHKLTTFALVDQIFLRELELLVENKKADLSKVRFPRRADGSIDDFPLPELLTDIDVSQTEDETPESVIEKKAVIQNNADKKSLPLWAWLAIAGGLVIIIGGTLFKVAAVFLIKNKHLT
jgi:hypothetical protein